MNHFRIRWKLFKKLITERRLGPLTLYKPQNHKECDKTVELILNKAKEFQGKNMPKGK